MNNKPSEFRNVFFEYSYFERKINIYRNNFYQSRQIIQQNQVKYIVFLFIHAATNVSVARSCPK